MTILGGFPQTTQVELGSTQTLNAPIAWPLVIDLDGTLICSDSLDETFLEVARTKPLMLAKLIAILPAGPAAVKAHLAEHALLDVETWPTHEELLAFANKEFAAGRTIVLATAANRRVAQAVAQRFPFIAEVIASDDRINCKGAAKADELARRFPGGFIYAGNASADIRVWEKSRGCVVVDAPARVLRDANQLNRTLAIFARQPLSLSVLRRSLRLHQWAKNALVFVPLVLGGRAGELSAWVSALIGFLALGLVASATYIVNDLWDLPSDRRHHSKRNRPLARGALSIRSGVVLATVLLGAGFLLASWVGGVWMLALYTVGTLSYSFALKKIPVLDVLMLATLFTLRLGLGIVLTDVRLSAWLLVFSMFVFLSLSMAKRHTEVLRLNNSAQTGIHGRGYTASDAPFTLGIGLSAMLGAVLIMILYLTDDAFAHGTYTNPAALWGIPPILFLFLGRIWLLCQRGELHDDPVAFALKDRVSLALGFLTIAIVIVALTWH